MYRIHMPKMFYRNESNCQRNFSLFFNIGILDKKLECWSLVRLFSLA
jgi:hypothetical protein